jgi:hypothetical protein
LLPLLLACLPDEPRTVADCSGPATRAQQDECLAKVVVALWPTDHEGATRVADQQITDPLVRDFAWLQVVMQADPQNASVCARIEDATLKARCDTRVQRPHLNRREDRRPEGGTGGG